MNFVYDVIVLGGGASGMVAAITAAERGKRTIVLEKGNRPGRKVSVSGNGRCNMMNMGHLKYYGESDFAERVFNCCSLEELTQFFQYYGLAVTEERECRVYPHTMKSASVLECLKLAMQLNGVDISVNTKVVDIQKKQDLFICTDEHAQEYHGKELIVCLGGAAQPKLGGNIDGYRFLSSFGHRLVPVFPALVPVETERKAISGLSGIRMQCIVSLFDQNQLLHREKGELLFTDYGLSGICVMQCSRFLKDAVLPTFELDFLSPVFTNPEDAILEITRRQKLYAFMPPQVLLEGILGAKLSYAVMKQAGIPIRGEKSGELTEEQLRQTVYTAYHYCVTQLSPKSFQEAQVTGGGAVCCEFDPETMESRLIPKLYAAGEILNVDGDCGGFNLMFAFATGRIAGGYRPGRKEEEEAL